MGAKPVASEKAAFFLTDDALKGHFTRTTPSLRLAFCESHSVYCPFRNLWVLMIFSVNDR